MIEDTPLIPASKMSMEARAKNKKGRWQMILLLIVCASPVIASYITFYWIKPSGGKTNYGQLIYPVEPVPNDFLLPLVKGKWTLLMARPAKNCEIDEEHCLKQLFLMRQVRTAMGKEKSRLQVVWLVTDQAQVSEKIRQAYDSDIAGVKIIELPDESKERTQINDWLNAHQQPDALQLLDPNGARMMHYPIRSDGPEFNKMRKDIEKLLKWNPIGKVGS